MARKKKKQGQPQEKGSSADGAESQSQQESAEGAAAAPSDECTYVIPCESCNAFLSLTKSTKLDQICQACKTPVTRLVELVQADKLDELPLPPVSDGQLITAVCTGEECERTAMFPRGYAIYCPVCLKNVMKEKHEVPKGCCEHYLGERGKALAEKLETCATYFSNKPNPLFQCVYLVIMCCWFYLYARYGHGEESAAIIPLADRIPGGVWLHMRIMELGFGIGVLLLVQCYRCDPGTVTKSGTGAEPREGAPDNHDELMALYAHPNPVRPCKSLCLCRRIVRADLWVWARVRAGDGGAAAEVVQHVPLPAPAPHPPLPGLRHLRRALRPPLRLAQHLSVQTLPTGIPAVFARTGLYREQP